MLDFLWTVLFSSKKHFESLKYRLEITSTNIRGLISILLNISNGAFLP